MARFHGCSLTQLSQMLNGFSLGLKYGATALREPGSRLAPWCQSCPVSGSHSLPCSSSGCQRTLTKVTSVRANGYPTYLNQSPSQIFEGLVLPVLQTQDTGWEQKNKKMTFTLGENIEMGGVGRRKKKDTLEHLRRAA